MPKMRTIDQAASWLLENDPETALTKTALCRLVTTGKIPSVKVGQKYLISLEAVEDFMHGTVPLPAPAVHGIREVQL